jgi:hypothetical protein
MVPVVWGAKVARSVLTVRVGGAYIELRRGFDQRLLREVVDALGGER